MANVPLGQNHTPGSGTYDPRDGYTYISNYGGNSVANSIAVINGLKAIQNITVGLYPDSIAYDSSDGYLYVANWGSNNVTVICGISGGCGANPLDSVISNVHVGSEPDFAVADYYGNVFISNYGSNNVSIVNGTTLYAQTSIGVGSEPSYEVYNQDWGNTSGSSAYAGSCYGCDIVFILNRGAGTTSVIQADSKNTGGATYWIAGTYSTDQTIYETGGVFDPSISDGGADGAVLVPAGIAGLSLINEYPGNGLVAFNANYVLHVKGAGTPAYDSSDGDAYIPDYYDDVVNVISPSLSFTNITDRYDPQFAIYDTSGV